MNYTYLHYQIAMTMLCGIGSIKARKILTSAGSPEAVFELDPVELQHVTGLSRSVIRQLERSNALVLADKILQEHSRFSIETIFIQDANYPRRLRHCADAPLVLYKRGPADLNPQKLVAVVGTRDASRYGKEVAMKTIEELKKYSTTIVSGLAHGIDTIAHRGALHHNIPTVAVLGHGLDRVFPAGNRGLAKEIAQNGALLTEFPFGTIPDKENFPKRNRIVAGMCDATIVVESRNKGGSLITADLANDYNRDVFAVPGNIHQERSSGCNKLIFEQKAHLFQSVNQFVKLMGWDKDISEVKNPQVTAFPELTQIQEMILSVIRQKQPIAVDLLSLKCHLSISALNVELFHLEIKGIVKPLPGKKYALQ